MPGNKKFDALMKTFAKEKIAVIHAPMSGEKGGPRTVAMVEVDKTLSDRDKMEEAFKLTNSINDAWWNNKDVVCLEKTRSTMSGDQVVIKGHTYECMDRGWRSLG